MKTNNFVAKHARTYNKAATHVNRKKAQKRGSVKHKAKRFEPSLFSSLAYNI